MWLYNFSGEKKPFDTRTYPALCPKQAPIATTVIPTRIGAKVLETARLPGRPTHLLDINQTDLQSTMCLRACINIVKGIFIKRIYFAIAYFIKHY